MEPKIEPDLSNHLSYPSLNLMQYGASFSIGNPLKRELKSKCGELGASSPFMCRVNPVCGMVGRLVTCWFFLSLPLLISDACCVSNEEEDRRRGDGKKPPLEIS